ncbi:hypothetical protein [Prochlorococcus sp. MIT 1307]|uniref:hypothetical protein n=1 Tax=Prochlorococcus sp. MIT 1307 TaxID=3096219 RepID=UPI002A756891|nr:hypothetical protein [Prochlorococcus sp. MIT 1307]
MNGNFGFVASCLPWVFLKENLNRLGITKLYVSTSELAKAYEMLRISSNKIELEVLPSNKIEQFITLINLFKIAKQKSNKVIFFHEACWLIFDIGFYIIKPNGEFYPQVYKTCFYRRKDIDDPKRIDTYLLKLIIYKSCSALSKINISPSFDIFFLPKDNNKNSNVRFTATLACKHYPRTKVCYPKDFYSKIEINKSKVKKDRVLVLTGTDICTNKELKYLMEYVVDYLLKTSIKVSLKGHPSSENINIYNSEKCELLDKSIAMETLNTESYSLVIGMGSTLLSRFPKRAICLLKLCKSVSTIDINKKIQHITSLSDEGDCLYPTSKEQLINMIDNRVSWIDESN